ncbi:unnamed protein product [Polarella glacialis]|uniref:Uncharacterized protein n=1 Tax=Polarella glacialis TaxID=89957 RepID=A0A813ES05_POLGL|nr:unnamed protein product [Polarella glacialis]
MPPQGGAAQRRLRSRVAAGVGVAVVAVVAASTLPGALLFLSAPSSAAAPSLGSRSCSARRGEGKAFLAGRSALERPVRAVTRQRRPATSPEEAEAEELLRLAAEVRELAAEEERDLAADRDLAAQRDDVETGKEATDEEVALARERAADALARLQRAEAFSLPGVEELRLEVDRLEKLATEASERSTPSEASDSPPATSGAPSLLTLLDLDDMTKEENIWAGEQMSREWTMDEWYDLFARLRPEGRAGLSDLLSGQTEEVLEAQSSSGLSDVDWAQLVAQLGDPELPVMEWLNLGNFLGNPTRRLFAKVALILQLSERRSRWGG